MKKAVFIVAIIFSIVSVILSFVFYRYLHKIDAELVGKSNITINVNDEYKDMGVSLKRADKRVNKDKYYVTVINNVDPSTIGKYEIKYDLKYLGKTYHLKRIVNVVDSTGPEININVDRVEKDYCKGTINTKLEYTAIDNYDGDVTNNIIITEENNKYILSVSDSSGNITEKELDIVTTQKPKDKIVLNGKNSIYIPINGTYNEQGATVIDGCDKKLEEQVIIEGSVDTTSIGTYTITYKALNTSLKRKVIVYKNQPKTIYLTFDDGPGGYTKGILDTLNKYGVRATFFVTNQFPSYSYLIGEEHKLGHLVAVHTYSHKYDVYSSLEAYVNDFNKMNEIIKNYTGSYSNLFRFPGGSSNTISRNYKKDVVSEIANYMTNQGYSYFDWNISSGDASGASSNQIYNNVVNGVAKCSSCVILMHDIKKTTANALDGILNNLTSQGYSFDVLNESMIVHHTIVN